MPGFGLEDDEGPTRLFDARFPNPDEIIREQSDELASLSSIIIRERKQITLLRVSACRLLNALFMSVFHEGEQQFTQDAQIERLSALLKLANIVNIDWYLERYPDVMAAGFDPLQHFVQYGWKEGRAPSSELENFDATI